MKPKRHFPEFLNIGVVARNLKIVPYLHQIENNGTKYVTNAQLVKLLSEVLLFEFKLLTPADRQYGDVLPDGNWSGVIGMVEREEADIGIAKLSFTEDRATAVDFSYPYQYVPITFITDEPQYTPDVYGMLHPFSILVWISVTISLVFVFCASRIFQSAENASEYALLNIFGTLVEKSTNFRFRKLSTKLFILSWIVGAMFISFSYKAVFLSHLTYPSLTGIRDIPQLTKVCDESSFRCSTYDGTDVYPGKFWKKINKCLERSGKYTDDIKAFLRPTAYGKAYIGLKPHLSTLQKSFFVSDDAFFVDFFSIAVRKSFCCKRTLDTAIHRIAAVGILQKFVRDEVFFLALGGADIVNEKEPNRKLSLNEFSGAFFVLALGFVLSCFILVIEIFSKRRCTCEKCPF